MLPTSQRIHGKSQVREIIQKGTHIASEHLVLHALSSLEGFRAAVVVSTKVAKSAVERNRLRRYLYTAIAEYSRPLSGSLVIRLRQNGSIKKEVLKQEVWSLLTRFLPE